MAGELVFLSGKEPTLPMLDDRQGAKAIVLNFIDPVPAIDCGRTVKHCINHFGEHGTPKKALIVTFQ